MTRLVLPIYDINKFAHRYTRNALKNDGDSLAFFDNSALELLDFTGEGVAEEFINHFKTQKIRPVLSIEIIGELIKGLPSPKEAKFEGLKKKKMAILSTFKESGLLWSLPIKHILHLEYYNRCHQRLPHHAHDFLYVFADHPLGEVPKDPSRKFYPCDKVLPYRFGPDRPTVTHNGDIERWFELEMISTLPTIKDDFKGYQETISNEGSQFLPSKGDIHLIPFTTVWNHLVKEENPNKAGLPNERLDTLHGTFALSYCDYLISKDSGLSGRSRSIADSLGLKVLTRDPDEFL